MSIHSRQVAERLRRAEGRAPSPLVRARERVETWYRERVFSHDLARLPRGKRLLNHWLRVVYLATQGFLEDACLFRAAALTYITVLSLVPLLAFTFAVTKGLGLYQSLVNDTLKPLLDRTFGPLGPTGVPVPGAEDGHQIREAFEQVLKFVDGTNVSGLGAIGLVLLLWTVIKLLGTIEESFNHIWGATRSRSLVRKLTDYLAMVVVTPILLLAAAAITTGAQSAGLRDWVQLKLGLGPLLEVGVKLTPLFSLWIAFAFLYLAMPNARTRWRSAVIGGLVGGTLWQLTLVAHLRFQLDIARYNAIYAGFAAIPIFLIWMQISWVAVLLGAEVCFAHQSAASYYPDSPAASSLRERERIALRVMARVAARSLRGEPPCTTAELAGALGVSLRPLELVLAELVEGRLLALGRENGADTYLLARDLDLIQVKTVLDLLRGSIDRSADPALAGSDAEIAGCLVGLDEAQGESRHNLPLRALAEHEPQAQSALRAQRAGRG